MNNKQDYFEKLNVRMPSTLYERLRRAAKRRNISIASYVRLVLSLRLDSEETTTNNKSY